MLGLMSLMLAMDSGINYSKPNYTPAKESDKDKKRRLKNMEIEVSKGRGLKEFIYGEHSVWAINQKNADRKAKKNNWI